MLLRSESRLDWVLHLNLVFDDDTTKEATIQPGQYLLLKFRRDNTKFNRAGMVKKIEPVVVSDKVPMIFDSCIVMDFSAKYSASRVRIKTGDILDFRVVTQEEIQALAPDYIITDEMFDDTFIIPNDIKCNMNSSNGVGCAGCQNSQVLQ